MKVAAGAILAAGGAFMSLAGVADGAAGAELELAVAGKTDYVIVLAEDASPSEKHGARELTRFLKEMSGAEFPVTPERGRVPAKAILVGRGRTVGSLVDDSVRRFYGPAAPAMRRYIDLMHDNVEKNGFHVRIYDPATAPYLGEDVLAAAEQCFDDAEDAARIRPEYLRRVQRDRLAIRYVRLMQDIERWRESGREAAQAAGLWTRARQFAADLESHGAKRISEPQTIRDWLAGLRRELGQ
jgi:hypothetical protein